jgi:hypothetical protein
MVSPDSDGDQVQEELDLSLASKVVGTAMDELGKADPHITFRSAA